MAEIKLHGDCLVNRAAELRRLLSHYLAADEKQLEIDLSSTNRCDLSFFQLFCSAGRSFAKQGRRLLLRGSLPASVAIQFEKAGLMPGCARCECDRCVFKEMFTNKTL